MDVELTETCETCGHDLVPTGVYDPDTLLLESYCSQGGDDHGTHWTEAPEQVALFAPSVSA